MIGQHFHLVHGLPFILITVSFEGEKISVFMQSNLSILSFTDYAFSVISMIWGIRSTQFFLMFSSRNFIALGFT